RTGGRRLAVPVDARRESGRTRGTCPRVRGTRGVAYTVLEPSTGDVIGCVYVNPGEDDSHDACLRSWVRASRAELDVPLWRTVSGWLATDWPFAAVDYAAREGPRS